MLENQKDKETLNLKVGDQAVFLRNTSLTPEDRGKATFVSSDPSVATVNERGVVTAHSAGSATIQVKFGSNETVVCKVTVTEKPKRKEPETPDTENRIPSVSDRPETPESGNTRPSQKIPSVGSVKKLNGVHYTVTKTSAKGGTAEVTDCGFLTGEYSLVLRNLRSPHSAPYMISATLPVRRGKPYRLALWVKANGNGSVCLTFETLRKEIPVSGEWQKIEWRFTTPADFPRMARLMIRMQHELRTLMLDCVSFSEQ